MRMIKMGRHTGFTLIELIIVIVILGVLSAVAAPRFLDISSDARAANVEGLEAVITDAARQVYAKAFIEGLHNSASATVSINNIDVDIVYGYPQSGNVNSVFSNDFVAWIDVSAQRYNLSDGSTDWLITDDESTDGITLGTSNNGNAIGFVLDSFQEDTGDTDNISNCGVSYEESSGAGMLPTIESFVSEC